VTVTVGGVSIPSASAAIAGLDTARLRNAIREEYSLVATEPSRSFHFHTGHPLARMLGYDDAWLEGVPEDSIVSFAGTGNPFSVGPLRPGQRVLDVGCGAGMDSLIAARMVGAEGHVIGVDMTEAMLEKARRSAAGMTNVEFHLGVAESLPVASESVNVVISNGVLNLTPDKLAALREMARVLVPGGRLQLGDILVDRPLSEKAKRDIDLWKG
jgi:arsenite methyltransferase